VCKEPKEKYKPVPPAPKIPTSKMYDKKVKPAATIGKVGGYNDSGVSKKDYGI
jgi:hypothetical protein